MRTVVVAVARLMTSRSEVQLLPGPSKRRKHRQVLCGVCDFNPCVAVRYNAAIAHCAASMSACASALESRPEVRIASTSLINA